MENNDPSLDFPIQESVEDAFGKQRSFIITYEALALGYRVEAQEEGNDGLGYEFSSFSETSPYSALGSLREKMYRTLAMRHITKLGITGIPNRQGVSELSPPNSGLYPTAYCPDYQPHFAREGFGISNVSCWPSRGHRIARMSLMVAFIIYFIIAP